MSRVVEIGMEDDIYLYAQEVIAGPQRQNESARMDFQVRPRTAVQLWLCHQYCCVRTSVEEIARQLH